MADWAHAPAWGATTADDEWEDVAAAPPAKPRSNGSDAAGATKALAAAAAAAAAAPAPRAREPDDALASARRALAGSERRVLALTKERDALQAAAAGAAGKGARIEEVLEEGRALSVKIAEREGALRAAKGALREKEGEVEKLRAACAKVEAKVEAAAAKNRTLETSEKAACEGKEAAERRLRQIESDLRSKSSSSAALEAARSQLEALRKSHAAALETLTMRLRAEGDAKEEAAKERGEKEADALNKAMAELRVHLTEVSESAGWKEDQLRREASELRSRAQSLEARNEELAEAVPGATRPLLRQVEALQAAAAERSRATSAIERSQRDRLRAAEAGVAAATERERAADGRISNLLTRIASLEEQVKLAHEETGRLSSELRDIQRGVADADVAHRRELDAAQVNTMRVVREKEGLVDELSKARAAHLDESEASDERERVLGEKVQVLETRLDQLQARAARHAASSSPSRLFSSQGMNAGSSYGQLGASDSTSSLLHGTNHLLTSFDDTRSQGSLSDVNAAMASPRYDSSAPFAESASAPGGVYDSERLQASLRARTGEIASLQAQVANKESASQALADEVVNLTSRVEELTVQLKDAPELRAEFLGLKHRHETLLVILGEREERIQELEADLVDVNQMYKEQITDLLLKLEAHA